MVKFLYCVWDTIRQEMNQPFIANNAAHAQRVHQASLKEVPPEYQGELELYCLGEVTMDTMEIEPQAPREVPMALMDSADMEIPVEVRDGARP